MNIKTLIFLFSFTPSLFAQDFPQSMDETALKQQLNVTEQEEELKDRLAIGGSLFTDMSYAVLNHQRFENNRFTNPNLLWLYMDSKFPKDVRFFAKGSILYDPTLQINNTTAALDELKIMFNVSSKVFFSIGKQKIKHGTGRLWNPTDFLNTVTRDPFYSYDRREGKTLVKMQIPIGNSNFYTIAALDDATNIDKAGYYMRYELPFFEASEISLSIMAKNNTATKFGIDLSTDFFGMDLYVETSAAKGSDKTLYMENPYLIGTFVPYTDKGKYFLKTTAGLSYDLNYADNDTLTLNGEYFYNSEGYANSASYTTMFYNNAFSLFNMGKHYAMFLVSMPKPFSWDRYTFMLLNVMNISDESFLTRLQAMKQFTNELAIGLNITAHYGRPDGEFKIGNQMLDFGFRMEINF